MNLESVKRYCEKNDMLPTGAQVLCACSGGADSVCLLHLLHRMEGIRVICAHFNHRLRGAESDRDEVFVKQLCGELGIPFCSAGADVSAYAAENGLGTEEAARKLRYDYLASAALENGCSHIATAHNADDNAETVLMSLARGAGLRGLSGIPPVRGNIIRPLLGFSRAEIEAYLLENGLPHVEDSSNAGDDYTRNRVRHHLLPQLRELNPAAVRNISSATELLREDESYLSGLANAFIADNLSDGSVPVQPLVMQPKPVAMRVLRTLCGDPGRKHLDAVYALCQTGAVRGEADLPGLQVTKEGERLYFGTIPEAPTIARREILVGKTTPIFEIGSSIYCSEEVYCGEIHNSFNTFFFKSENICGKIYVASRREGDSVRLFGRGCTKTLKKLFSEAGIPLRDRARTPVFYDEAGVIAICGFGVAERCVPEQGKKAIKIEII